ncbi:hypothetical protein JIQ42_07052 [Leishmania sp. Namibia]|uniref:hypothetical protein n=1 Tax=Leishmania sp. Namibia TaxID=2802991 RepID=UPI001B67886C|nr:hypothetical protein JIQ42_07052 [Leishmania sp. Namibia]
MELPAQQHLFSSSPRPYTASLVWVCLACGRLAPYQAVLYDTMDNADGFDSHPQSSSSAIDAMPGECAIACTALGDREAAAHVHSSFPPKTTQHRHGQPQYGAGEHIYHASHEPPYSPCGGGVAGCTAITVGSLPSSPVTSAPVRQGQPHSCVNDASDSYLSQAASSSYRTCGQPQCPLSVTHRTAGAVMEDRLHLGSVGRTSDRQKRRESALVFAAASNLHASDEAVGADKAVVDDGISSSRRRASTAVTPPATPQLSSSLESTGNRNSALALSARAPAVATLPQILSASPSLWRHTDVNVVQSPLSTGARSAQEEEDAMHSLRVLLMEEHLIGSREMRFCCSCREVRCAEIRKATDMLPSSLPAGAAADISYGVDGGDMMRAAQGAVGLQHEDWSAPPSPGCRSPDIRRGRGTEVGYGLPISHNCHCGREPESREAPRDLSAPAAESGSQSSKTARWRSPLPRAPLTYLHQQAQPQQSARVKAREEMSPVHHDVAFSLARLLSKVKAIAVAAVQNFHPLSPALPTVYLCSHCGDDDETAMGNDRYTGLGSDSAQRSARSIPRLPPHGQKGHHPRCPPYDPSEGVEMRGGYWTTASTSTETSRATPSMSVSAERTPLCSTSPLTLAGGGPSKDLNNLSLDSSGQPSWALTAPDEEEAHRAEEGVEDLIIQHLLGNVPGDENAGRGGGEDAYMRARRCADGTTFTSSVTSATAAAEATGTMRAWKEKWNSISVAEALWRLVLPSFGAPFLTAVSMPAAASADRAVPPGRKRPIGCLMDWIAFSSRPRAVESTSSSAVGAGARPYRGFRGDVEEAIHHLDAAQLEVAKLRLQQVLTAVNAEQARREDQSKVAHST